MKYLRLFLKETIPIFYTQNDVEASWNLMAHAQKPEFVFQRNGRVHLNRQGRQFSRLLAAKVCASAVVMLDTPCSEVVWRVLATHSIRQFPLHFPSLRHPVPSHFKWSLPILAPSVVAKQSYQPTDNISNYSSPSFSKGISVRHVTSSRFGFQFHALPYAGG